MHLFSDSPASPVSSDSYLVSIHFLICPVRLNRLIAPSKFADKFLSLDRVARPNRGDLVNDIIHGAPSQR